jgi:hypothetical protein
MSEARTRTAEERLIASMRAALATFDADPSDRHPVTCACALCEFVQSCREVAEIVIEKRRVEGEPCPHHDAAHVCEDCPEQYVTEGRGFVHRSELKGRTPLRQCEVCMGWKTPAQWSLGYWFRCAECGPTAVNLLGEGRP